MSENPITASERDEMEIDKLQDEIARLTKRRDALAAALRIVRHNLPGNALYKLIKDENEPDASKWPTIDIVIGEALATLEEQS